MRNKMYPVRLVSDFCRCVTQYQQWISGSAYWQMSHPCHRKKINSLHTLHCGLECWEWHKMLPACAGSVRVLRGMRWNIRLGLIWQRTRQWLCTTLRIIPYSNPSFLFFPKWNTLATDYRRQMYANVVLRSHNTLRLKKIHGQKPGKIYTQIL